jgi:hypothetical protein
MHSSTNTKVQKHTRYHFKFPEQTGVKLVHIPTVVDTQAKIGAYGTQQKGKAWAAKYDFGIKVNAAFPAGATPKIVHIMR